MKKLCILIFILIFNLSSLFAQQNKDLVKEIGPLLKSQSWAHQCFAILRMEKYPTEKVVHNALISILASHKHDWRVKVFALRTIGRLSLEVPKSTLLKLKDPFLIKAALVAGISIENQHLENIVLTNLRSKDSNTIITICEIAALSSSDRVRKASQKALDTFLKKIDLPNLSLYGKRVSDILGIKHSLRQNWKSLAKMFRITTPEKFLRTISFKQKNYLADQSQEDFIKCSKYYEGFHKKDIELVTAIDGTGSMRSVMFQTQSATIDLMQILGAFSKSIKFGVVVYRDREDGKPELIKLTDKQQSVIKFLAKIKLHGGGFEREEWVLSGIEKAESAGWRSNSTKHLIVLGDAAPHKSNMPKIQTIVEELINSKNIKTHAISTDKEDIKDFKDISKWGKGNYIKFDENKDLAKILMKLSMDPFVHEFFDEFYRIYKIYCY